MKIKKKIITSLQIGLLSTITFQLTAPAIINTSTNIVYADEITEDYLNSLELKGLHKIGDTYYLFDKTTGKYTGESGKQVYLGSFFKDNKTIQGQMFFTLDGEHLHYIDTGTFYGRDMSFIYKNGSFYGTRTKGAGRTYGFYVQDSSNLKTFNRSSVTNLDFDINGYEGLWAPEWLVDYTGDTTGDYVYYCAKDKNDILRYDADGNPVYRWKIYRAKTKSLPTNIINPELCTFDDFEDTITNTSSNTMIDPAVIKTKDGYIMAVKWGGSGSRSEHTDIYKSTNGLNWNKVTRVSMFDGGPITETLTALNGATLNSSNATVGYEGGTLTYINGTYYLYIDHYIWNATHGNEVYTDDNNTTDGMSYDGKIHIATSTDLKNWTYKGTLESEGYPLRHGSINPISDEAAAKIMKIYSPVTVKFDNNGADNPKWTKAIVTVTQTDSGELQNRMYWYKDGYILSSWNTKPDGSGKKYTFRYNDPNKYTSDDFEENPETLYAQWQPAYTRIRYDANGGTGTMDDDFVRVDQKYTTKNNTFKKTGYTFNGWEYQNTTIAAGSKISDYPDKTMKPESTVVFKSGLEEEMWYGQGATVCEKDGKKYLAVVYVPSSKNTTDTNQWLYIYDFNTQEIVRKKSYTTLGHANDITWNPDLQRIVTTTKRLINLELTEETKFTFKNSDGTNMSVSNSSMTYNDGKYYVIADGEMNIFGSDFKLIKKANISREELKDLKTNADFGGQGTGAEGDYLLSPMFTGSASNTFITMIKKQDILSDNYNSNEQVYYFSYLCGDITSVSPRREIQDVYYDSTVNKTYYFGDPAGGATGGVNTYMQVHEKDSIPTNVLKATWKATDYKITYNLDGGTNNTNNPSTYTIEDAVTLKNPTKKGYTFTGWKEGNSIKKGSTGDKTFTAQWTPNVLTINYYPGIATGDDNNIWDGSSTIMDTRKYNYDGINFATNGLPNTDGGTWKLVKTGYYVTNMFFVGVLNSTVKVNQNTIFETVQKFMESINKDLSAGNQNVDLYAELLANPYQVKFNKNSDATGQMDNQKFVYDTSQNLTANEFSRKGYTFNGWNTKADGKGTSYKDKQSVSNLTTTKNDTVNLYAQWKANQYKVMFDGNGNTGGSAPTTITADYDTSITIPETTPTKTGYTFTGWKADKVYKPGDSYKITDKDVTLVAQWKINTYTVTFTNENGNAIKTETVEHGSDATAPEPPVKTGYTFNKWDKSFNNITGNITVKSVYTINEYTVKFTDGFGNELKSEKIKYNNAATPPTQPQKEGYRFIGWDKAYDKITGDITVNAKWIQQFNVAFTDGQGNILKTEIVDKNTNATAPEIPTRKGYTFAGWDNGFNNITKETTINATWNIINYKITTDLNGGEANNPLTYTVEDTFKLNIPTKKGYTFKGWESDKFLGTEVEIKKGTTGDKTFKVLWDVNTYAIKYNLDGGTAENLTEYNIETDSIKLNNPEKKGYKFIGWTGTGLEAPTMDIIIPQGTIGNKDYTANWEVINYDISYNLNGGTANNPATYTIEDEIIFESPIKEHYDFTGWSEDLITKGMTGNKTFTANYKPTVYKLSVDLDGGEGEYPTEYTIESIPKLNNPTKKGYSFIGWDNDFVDIQDKQIKALWEIEKYNITYDIEIDAPVQYTIEDETIIPNPTKEEYKFLGWTYEGTDTPTKDVKIEKGNTGDLQFVSHWEEIPLEEDSQKENKQDVNNKKSGDTNNNVEQNTTKNNTNKTKTYSVDTGDKNNSTIWLYSISGVSLFSLFTLIKAFKKNKQNKEK